ncbi:kinase-like domain-containing protein [Mycena sp. CBHHK59/15]|nr:kinase-like domain-containing protein [Mycena sp. CBHHK59/15]
MVLKRHQALAYLQCMTCGVAWKRLPYTDKCGLCHQNSLAAAGIVNHGLEVALAAHSNAFNIHIHHQPKPNTLAITPPQPTVELNTVALDQFRNVGYNDADCVKVYAEPRVINKIDHQLGITSRSYSPETLMEEIIADLLKGWNITWLKTHLFPLIKETTELCFHGNQNPLANAEHLAVLDFYQVHKNAGNHEAYFTKMPKHAAVMKGRVIAIELWMKGQEPTASTSAPSSSVKSSIVKKRKLAASKANEAEQTPSKRPRISGTIETNFVRQLPGPDPTKSTKITLLFPKISIEQESCKVKINWPAPNATATAATEAALISDDIFHSGKMKHCYKLSIGEDQFIAKHFFEIGRGEDEVSLSENKTNLEAELIRCEMARWFLKCFRIATDEINMETAKNFEITQCRLAQEVVKVGAKPSPASGVVPEVFESAPATWQNKCAGARLWNGSVIRYDTRGEVSVDSSGHLPYTGHNEVDVEAFPHPAIQLYHTTSRIVWLLEPLRNTSVTHYTGTMEHPAGTGQLVHTLSAFVHYAFQFSCGNILFADIQGSSGRLTTKTMGIIIFDLMSHTPEEDSGVGDHSPNGIERWRDQHDCNIFCKRLELEVGDSDDEEEQ